MKFFNIKFPKDVKTIFLFLVLAVMLAYGAYNTAGIALDTAIPVVSVVSNSMKHDESIESTHYTYLSSRFDFDRDLIDSWPLNKGFIKGDLLVIEGANATQLEVGDVIVYKLQNTEDLECEKFQYSLQLQGIEKVVHRIVQKFEENGNVSFMTKGDHNFKEDPCKIDPEEIEGKAISKIPFLGYLKLIPAQILGAI